jgi:hypothetical protein
MQVYSPAIPAEYWLYRDMEDTPLNKYISLLIPLILPNRSSPTLLQGGGKPRPYHTRARRAASCMVGVPLAGTLGWWGGPTMTPGWADPYISLTPVGRAYHDPWVVQPLHLFILAFDGIIVRAALFRGIALLGATAEVGSRTTGTSTGLPVN